jgi:hypothetical protein
MRTMVVCELPSATSHLPLMGRGPLRKRFFVTYEEKAEAVAFAGPENSVPKACTHAGIR